ncbi:MAG: hypothetical protein R3A79_18580 [Nannocystaceae bacterium]
MWGREGLYPRHESHRQAIPAGDLEAFVALLAVDPEPSVLGRPRTPSAALRAALATIVEHLVYAVGLGLGVAGAGVVIVEGVALALELAGVDPALGWALTGYLVVAAALLILGGAGRLLFAADPQADAARLVAGAAAQRHPSSQTDLGAARTRLRRVRGRRAAAPRLGALLRRIPARCLASAVEVEWRAANHGSWSLAGLRGPAAEVKLTIDGSDGIVATNRATHERVTLRGSPDDPQQVAGRDAILRWLGVEPDETSAPREPPSLRAVRLVFWLTLAIWAVTWAAAVVVGALAVAERLPSQWAALAGYVVAGSVAALLFGLRSRLPFRHPGLRGPILSGEERAADIYEAEA